MVRQLAKNGQTLSMGRTSPNRENTLPSLRDIPLKKMPFDRLFASREREPETERVGE